MDGAFGGGTSDVWVYDFEQGTFTRLTFEGRNEGPFWSPDGLEIGFTSDSEGDPQLYARPTDLSADARLLLASPDADGIYEGQWTPDGGRLVYRRGIQGTTDLYHAALHPDSVPVVFLDSEFRNNSPALSPNGRWLAYVSSQSGQDEVYVRPFPGPGGRATVSVEGGQGPVWASDREIIYHTVGSWVSATVRSEPTFAVEARVPFGSSLAYMASIGTQQYDVSPVDGRLLAIRTSAAGSDVHDVVVLNWFEELRERVPN